MGKKSRLRRRLAAAPIRKRRKCPFIGIKPEKITLHYANVELLKKFISKRGRILPQRITGTSPGYHRQLVTAIKRARYMALLPFVSAE